MGDDDRMQSEHAEPVTHDRETDILYVRLADDDVGETKALDDLRLVDYAADGAVVGIEFIEASSGIDLRDLSFRERVEELIAQSGQQFKTFA
jgi:uncharacterized protein YuzE